MTNHVVIWLNPYQSRHERDANVDKILAEIDEELRDDPNNQTLLTTRLLIESAKEDELGEITVDENGYLGLTEWKIRGN